MTPTVFEYEGTGYEPGDVLVRLYGDLAWRSVCIPKEDQQMPWIIAKALNEAYARGRAEAYEELRRLIGVK